MKKTMKSIAFAVTCAFLASCATNSVTGRKQFNMMDSNTVIKKAESHYTEAINAFEKENKLSTDEALIKRVTDITNSIIDQAVLFRPDSARWDWKLEVIDDEDTMNAWCMPGGKMAIYTGIINKLDMDDDEIAAIMGHEIAHALADHGAEKMSVQMASNLAVLLIGAAAGKTYEDKRAIINVGSVAALAFVNLPNSRDAEYEADKVGVELAARAGFDPAAAARLWEKMARQTKSEGRADFLSTHPAPIKRQETLHRLAEDLNLEKANWVSDEIEKKEPNPWIRKPFNQNVYFEADKYLNDKMTLSLSTKIKEEPSGSSTVAKAQVQKEPVSGSTVLASAVPSPVSALSAPSVTVSKTSDLESSSIPSIPEGFENGSIKLDCGIRCQPMATAMHVPNRLKYNEQKWAELVIAVSENRFETDLNWFYLGMAAKSMGHKEAARIYLSNAIGISNQDSSCSVSLLTNCFGLKIPKLANEALMQMGFSEMEIPKRAELDTSNMN